VVTPGRASAVQDAPVEDVVQPAQSEDELVLAGSAPPQPARTDDGRRLTIAERRAAERRAAAAQEPAPGTQDASAPADVAPSAADGENEENR
jgi:preprotein translocase subunit SecD